MDEAAKAKDQKREEPKGPKSITEELYGGPLLHKRNRWDGSIIYQDEAPSLLRAES
jgi:hypothetical protein